MNKSQLMAILVLSAGLSACGGEDSIVVECEDGLRFGNLEEGDGEAELQGRHSGPR